MLLDKSNQKNLGTIKSSDLCTEIIKYSAPDETAVCNLASLALPTFIVNGQYDFQKLHDVTKVITHSLNRIIDINYYPITEARRSNFRHRPIGVGVQGLTDAFMAVCMPFDSPEAKELNIQIFETIYAALESSMPTKGKSSRLRASFIIKANASSRLCYHGHFSDYENTFDTT